MNNTFIFWSFGQSEQKISQIKVPSSKRNFPILIMFVVFLISFNFYSACRKERFPQPNNNLNKKIGEEVKSVLAKVAEAYGNKRYIIKKSDIGAAVLYDQKSKRILQTGGGFHESDIKLFLRISQLLPVRSIFIIGNAFGYSAFCLAEIFQKAFIDVIDAEIEGEDNQKGSEITRIIAQTYYPKVELTIGFSPQDTPKAVRPVIINEIGGYDLVFIDGMHTNEQIVKDFDGILPFLSPRCVVAIHDVGLYQMYQGFKLISEKARKNGFDAFISSVEWTRFGTGLVGRGINNLALLRTE